LTTFNIHSLKKLFSLFAPRSASLLGIDISSSSVKILEISVNGNQLCVQGYSHANLPPDALDGNVIKDMEAVTNCIKKMVNDAQFTTKNVALAVPDSTVISKVVQINEGLHTDEMEELIIIEADKFVPYPIDEVNVDFEVLGHALKNANLLDILIVASRAENVMSRVEAVNQAGLETYIVDVESYAVERVATQLVKQLPEEGHNKIIAIIDVGANYTHLFVLHEMHIIFTREEKFGGLQLIESIAEQYDMSLEEAENAREQGSLPEDYDSKILTPFKDMLLLQIKRTLQFFYSTSQYEFIDYILLAGGVAKEPELANLIQKELNIPTIIANPLLNMTINPRLDLEQIHNAAPALLVASGLALRQMYDDTY